MATVLDNTVLALKPSLFMIQPAPGTFQLLPLSVWVFFLSPIMGGGRTVSTLRISQQGLKLTDYARIEQGPGR